MITLVNVGDMVEATQLPRSGGTDEFDVGEKGLVIEKFKWGAKIKFIHHEQARCYLYREIDMYFTRVEG